ncbi:MAG: flagellar hook capping FlgD N-terminal domain-containing protein [Patescibacteria group bacterium]|nr:flagellar hook capping FlgD N-terminal domain-containing protein [Patescibacteria group bacterium]
MASATTSSIGITGTSGQQTTVGGDAYSKMGTEEFLKLLVTELSNQDPTSPTDTSAILSQLSQIREIQSTDSLTTTLESVLFGQNFTTANWLMGRNIIGLSTDGEYVTGVVDRVTLTDMAVQAHIGDSTIDLKNIVEVLPTEAASDETAEEGEEDTADADAAALEEMLNELLAAAAEAEAAAAGTEEDTAE